MGSDAALVKRTSPEILASDLTPLVLELAVWGVTEPVSLSWSTHPFGGVCQGRELLLQLDAIDDRGRVTTHGKEMAALGLHPRLSHMILSARRFGMCRLACEVAAILEERDFLSAGPEGWDSDLRLRLEAFYGNTDRTPGAVSGMTVDTAMCRTIRRIADYLKSRLNCGQESGNADDAGIVLSFAYPDRIAVRRPGDDPKFLLANGKGAFFRIPEPISAEPYLAVAELDGSQREAAIFLAAPVFPRCADTLFGGSGCRKAECGMGSPQPDRILAQTASAGKSDSENGHPFRT